MLLAVASKLRSLVNNSLIALRGEHSYSLWRENTALCREVRFLTPKTQFSSTLIPNLLETQPRIILQPEQQLSMNSTVFLQLLTTNSTCSIINSGFKP